MPIIFLGEDDEKGQLKAILLLSNIFSLRRGIS